MSDSKKKPKPLPLTSLYRCDGQPRLAKYQSAMAERDPKKIADAIVFRRREMSEIENEINALARLNIPNFHFLDHKVSTEWRCEKSPIGMCVWNLKEGCFSINCYCRYCGEPVERK